MEDKTNAVELAVALTTAWLGNPNTRCAAEDVHAFLKNSHATLIGLTQTPSEAEQDGAEPASEFIPAVSVRKSLADPDYIVSMIDGKRYRSLRRHLSTRDLTPETYRERYGLKADYPMVAPGYAAQRSKLAKELGLGRKGAESRAAKASASTPDATKSLPPSEGEPTSVGTQSKNRRSQRAKRVDAEAANAEAV